MQAQDSIAKPANVFFISFLLIVFILLANASELSEKVPSNRACSYSLEPFCSNGLLARARRAAAIKPVEFTQL